MSKLVLREDVLPTGVVAAPEIVRGTITILIPTYARSGLLRGAIRCVLAQTRPADQVIVLDDASPDDTAEVVGEFSSEARLRYVRNKENLGLAGNWAKGLGMVETDFFCILNDDDRLAPTFLETLVRPLEENGDLVTASSDHWIASAEGVRLLHLTEATSRYWNRHRLGKGPIGDYRAAAVRDQSLFVGSTVFRRDAVAGDWIDWRAQGAADLWLFYRCAGTGRTGYFTPERLLDYRAHSGGMTRSRGSRIYFYEGYRFVCGAIAADGGFAGCRRLFKERRYRAALSLAAAFIAGDRPREARAVLAEQWREDPGLGMMSLWCLAVAGRAGARIVRAAQAVRERAELRRLRAEASGGGVADEGGACSG